MSSTARTTQYDPFGEDPRREGFTARVLEYYDVMKVHADAVDELLKPADVAFFVEQYRSQGPQPILWPMILHHHVQECRRA